MGVNELLVSVTLIVQIQNGSPVGQATGFFYSKNDTLYLVTNRHVVCDEARSMKPDALRIRLHTDRMDLSKNAEVDVPLYSNGVPLWHAHPDHATKKIDIAVIELDQKHTKSKYVLKALSSSDFLPRQYVVSPGEDVMVIGFPRGVSDAKHNLPVVRNAMISSAYGVDFNGSPNCIVDANLHPGTSGSPVMTKPKNMWVDDKGTTNLVTGNPMYFIGVHSATLSHVSKSGTEPLGLASVWYAYLIEETIDSFPHK